MRVLSREKPTRPGCNFLWKPRKNSRELSRYILMQCSINTRCIVPSGTCSRRPGWERGRRRACSDTIAFRVQSISVDGRTQEGHISNNKKLIGSNARTNICIGIVVVDHGSKKESSNVMLDNFVELYKGMLGDEKIETNIVAIEKAHMEIAAPSVKDAVGSCVDKGAEVVVVAPYFLSRGRHILEDIPALVEGAQAEYKDVRCIIADPIGLDVRVVDVVHSRVEEALAALDYLDLEKDGRDQDQGGGMG